ncbi:hypothetical protein Mesau_06010 [Mesorhizobium australicum WSM2073]|uniref:TnsA endonuclease N terminal n=1 Tax=Mesorhizobium australicum (strain HAMBI 3006 / LMG 24608 / WSM2073) TaxID=754035 RepID=L0KW65_MESAW|nr:hypothetical protein [Mesorhizobium australicum]AGB48229.1 hypothetical protein Mesau_06010 [Mesorhizobium australicum WSM2073]
MRPRSSITPEYFGLCEAPSRMRQPLRFSRRGLIVGMSCASKLLGSRQHGSLLERDLHTLLEADPSFESFALEAHSLVYFAPAEQGHFQRRTYTPDVVARTTYGEIVVLEGKAAALRAKTNWAEKEHLIREAYWYDHGIRFCVLTEFDIRKEPRLSNCKVIVSRARGADDPDLALRLGDAIRLRPHTLGELYRIMLAPKASVFATLMALVYRGKAQFDLAQPVSETSTFSEALSR